MSVYASVARNRRESIFQLNPNNPGKSNFIITELFTNIEEVNDKSGSLAGTQSSLKNFLRSHHVLNPTVILALIFLGLSTALLCFFIDYSIQTLEYLRTYLLMTNNYIADFGIWILFCIVFTEIACFFTSFLSVGCQGSGVPEMKAIMSGVKIRRFFSIKTLAYKSIGIILAIGGGLSIGKEGPFVHISGILSHQISKLGIFSHIKKNISLRNQFLASAVAAGLASVFECPIGGVLYSIEVTSTYYIVNNMWRSAFCSIWCALGINWLRSSGLVKTIKPTDFPVIGLNTEILAFLMLGIFCGLLGTCFISFSSRLISLREHNTYPLLYGKYRYTLLIASICAVTCFITPYMRLYDLSVFNDMLHLDYKKNGWDSYNLGFGLVVYFLCKLFLTGISLSCQASAGVLYPLMAAGAVFGSLVAYIFGFIFTTSSNGIYAAVGAASLVSATTHTISVSVIVFELTGQIHYFLPMIISVLAAYSVSNFLTISIYDALLEIKGLPYLPSLKPSQLQGLLAKDIMEYSFPQITLNCKLKELVEAVDDAGVIFTKVPVVDSNNGLLYDIKLEKIKQYLMSRASQYITGKDEQVSESIKKYLNSVLGFAHGSILDDTYKTIIQETEESEEIKEFLNIDADFNDEEIFKEDAPFALNETTPLAKVHFLFIMLGFHQVYVIRRGQLVGMISRESFSKTRNFNNNI